MRASLSFTLFISFALLLQIFVQANEELEMERMNSFLDVYQSRGLMMSTKYPTKFPSKRPSRSPTSKPTPAPTTPYKSIKIASFTWATGFAFLSSDESMVVAERYSGVISMYNPVTNTTTAIAQIKGIDPKPELSDGLLGVAVDPNFDKNPFIYVYASRHQKGKPVDQIIKLKWNAKMTGVTTKQTVIWSMNRLPGAIHDGGRITFGPDGYLYVTVGDQNKNENAQDPKVDAGKILRMTSSGGVPKENPIKKSVVYAWGYRNSIGLTFDKKTGYIWSTDNGPTCNDELNLITTGSNYGWGPLSKCPETNADGENIQLPKSLYNGMPIAVTGLAFAWEKNDLFIGHLIPSSLRQVTLDESGTGVATDHGIVYYLPQEQGLLLAVESDSDGHLFYSTVTGVYKLELK